jgi:cytoskeletal protein RodZ
MAVGPRIQELREAQNLSIEQLSSTTKIRKDVLASIEAEEWNKLDLRVFVRNQVRLIANALKVNETELLELFDADYPNNETIYTKLNQENTPNLNIFDKQGRTALPVKRNPNWLYLIIGIFVVLAVSIFAYLSSGKADNSLPETDVTITESASPNPSQSTDLNTLGVSVELQASGRSWITANGSAGNSLFSSFLNAGDTITLTDSTSISLVIGDSGVVNVIVNDENLGFLGSSGTPVEITFPIQ